MPILAEQYGRFRVEDLDRPEVPEKGVEIIEGDLMVMAPAGKYHNRISHRLETLFEVFCKGKPELDFGGYNDGFLVERDPDSLLSPDASLYRYQPEKEKPGLSSLPILRSKCFHHRTMSAKSHSNGIYIFKPDRSRSGLPIRSPKASNSSFARVAV